MNNKLLLTAIVSFTAIAQLPQEARAESFSPDAAQNLDALPEASQIAPMLESTPVVAVQSIATPEVITSDVIATPEVITSEVTAAPEVLLNPVTTSSPVEVPQLQESLVAQSVQAPMIAQSSASSGITTTTPVKIEVGTRGIPPITDLPARVSLPSQELLPGNFELPINIGQTVDRSIATASPITDRFADPALTAHLQTVQTFLVTKPPAITIPCDSLPTADCSPMMNPVNPNAYAAPGLSLRSEDPAANPDSPSAIGPVVRERLRLTVDEVQAYRSAYSQNLVAWSDRVRQCMDEKPRLYVLRSDGAQLPVFFNGQEGTVVRNNSGQAVCTN
jgi:hypothetical protein